MPLRVKCRCGQELVLRFNEWVYALFGLLVLSLLVNGTALVLIVLQLSALESEGGERAVGEEVSPPEETAREEPESSAPRPDLLPGPVPTEGGPSAPGTSTGAPAPVSGPGGAEKVALEPPQPGLAPDSPVETARKSEPKSEPRSEPKTSPAARVAKKEPASRLLLPESRLPLERLIVVGRSEDLRVLLGFLGDEDGVVSRAALKKLLDAPPPAETESLRDHLPIALARAPGFWNEGGRELVRKLLGQDPGQEPGQGQGGLLEWARKTVGFDPARKSPPEALAPVLGKAEALRASSPAAQALEKMAKGKMPEIDLLLALDVTESMEGPLKALSTSRWIPGAFAWSLPGMRMGLLLYGDEVLGTTPLSAEPAAVANALAGLKQEAGGDVPEGVHEALRAALQLGRFDWRPRAQKHIVFVGDGPPPRQEVPGLLSLARECHAEGGYRIHAISVNPEEGRTATLHFPELAAAGGGRAITAPGDRLVSEIFLTPFPDQAREELMRLVPLLVHSIPDQVSGR